VLGGRSRRLEFAQGADRVGAFGHVIEQSSGRTRSDAWQQLRHAKPRDAVADVLRPAQNRQHVLDVRGVQKFEPTEFLGNP
jgi:hypothetical protein